MYVVTNQTSARIIAGPVTIEANQTILLPTIPTALNAVITSGAVTSSTITDNPSDLTIDSAGLVFAPSTGVHTYGYDGSGNLTTDTCVNGSITRIKTYTWTNGQLTGESNWVKQ